MMCSKCSRTQENKPPRVRFTPTFYHSPIFNEYQQRQSNYGRCSATYHSTVFNQDIAPQKRQVACCCNEACSNVQNNACDKNECCYQEQRKSNANRSTFSATKFERHKDLNPHTHYDTFTFANKGLSNHKLLWFDPAKQILLKESTDCGQHGYSRQRKLLELSSNPIQHPQQNLAHSQCNRCYGQAQGQPIQEEVHECLQCHNEIKAPIVVKEEVQEVVQQRPKEEIKKQPQETPKRQTQKKVSFVENKRPQTVKKQVQSRNQPTFKMVKKQR